MVSTEWTERLPFFDQEPRHRLSKHANKRRGLTFANGTRHGGLKKSIVEVLLLDSNARPSGQLKNTKIAFNTLKNMASPAQWIEIQCNSFSSFL